MKIFQSKSTFQMVARPLKWWKLNISPKIHNHSEGQIDHSEGFKVLFIMTFLYLSTFSCSNTNENTVVGSVNGKIITSEEIAFAYEFSPRIITQQGKEKALKMILDGIIKKELFAAEAKKYNLHNDSLIQYSVNYFERSAINRELYLKHVRDSITVNENKLREVYKRSKEVLFVKHFLALDRSEAEKISQGKIDVEHSPLIKNKQVIEIQEFGIVDEISFNEINNEMEDILYSLPLLQLSEPFFDGKFYHVFRVIDKSINTMQTEEDFLANKESLASATQKRQEHVAAFNFVNRIMKPQNLIIKSETLNWMVENIYAQNSDEIKPRYLQNKELQSFSGNQNKMLTQDLAIFKSGNINIDDFVKIYQMNPIEISSKNKTSIRKGLKNIIAIYVRDKVFSELGYAENLDTKESVLEEKKYWETKLLANEMKKHIYNEIKLEGLDSLKLEERYNSKIEELTKELYAKSKIEINEEKLIAIQTSDEGLNRKVDFFAKRLQ